MKRDFAGKVSVLVVVFLSVAALALYAGPRKTGGTYSIESDVLDAAGRPGLTGGTYWMINAAAQPVGYASGTGGVYALESGYISGMEVTFDLTKAVDAIEAPAGYGGGANDPVPGAKIKFLLTLINYGEAADPDSALIEDYIPSNATYYPGSIVFRTVAQTDTSDGDDCRYDTGPPKRVVCENFNVAAGETATMSFELVIE